MCVCPGDPSPCRHPPGCCGAETHPTVCRGLSPTWTLPVNRRRRGPGGVWGAALVGGWGRRLPERTPSCTCLCSASCRRGLSAFSPRGPSTVHTVRPPRSTLGPPRALGRRVLGGLSVPLACQTSYRCRGRAGAKPLGRKITPVSALMAHEVILWDTGAGFSVFCKPVTTPRREAWMTSYQSPTHVRKRSRVLEQLRFIGAN